MLTIPLEPCDIEGGREVISSKLMQMIVLIAVEYTVSKKKSSVEVSVTSLSCSFKI